MIAMKRILDLFLFASGLLFFHFPYLFTALPIGHGLGRGRIRFCSDAVFLLLCNKKRLIPMAVARGLATWPKR